MLSTIKMLRNVASVNFFEYADAAVIFAGSTNAEVYFRLWQSDRKDRYVPASGSSLNVIFPRMKTVDANSPTNQDVTKAASNPYSGDTSIWKVTLDEDDIDDVISGGMVLELTESGNTTKLFVQQVITKLEEVDRG